MLSCFNYLQAPCKFIGVQYVSKLRLPIRKPTDTEFEIISYQKKLRQTGTADAW
jgi:hypothetical protein